MYDLSGSLQVAASGGELSLSVIVPVVAFAALLVSWLVADEPKKPENLSKVSMLP